MPLISQLTRSWVVPRIDIKDPSLVLYLPLWYPHSDMTGSTIYSYDRYRHTGTVTGATWGVRGRTFDGASGHIDVPHNAVFNVSNITLEVWAYLNGFGEGGTSRFMDKGGGAAPFVLYMDTTNDTVECYLAGAAHSSNNNAITLSTWLHIVATYDGANVNFFVNGVAKGSPVEVGAMTTDTDTIYIGNTNDDTRTMDGILGEVRIYNRALSIGEILRNYQATKWRYK